MRPYARLPGSQSFHRWICVLLAACHAAAAEDPDSGPAASLPLTTVQAPHIPPWAGPGSFDGTTLDQNRIQAAPQQRMDSILRTVPGFRLFRRSDSLISHPTSQGLSLRNVGPSGASRTEVLLDGIPIQDPFGGWIPWSRLTPLAISSATALRDAGVSPWGGANLGGILALESRFLQDRPFTAVDTSAGSALEHSITALSAQDIANSGTRIFGGYHHSLFSGYPVIRKPQRGPVDTDASNRTQWWEAGVRQNLGPDWSLTLRAATWDEARGNGSPLARNRTEGADFSLKLAHDTGPLNPAAEWIWYRQQRTFQSTFTSITPDRRSELPVLDQFDVPATATGFIHRNRIPIGDSHLLSSGFDLRQVDGQTHERFRNLGAGYTRARTAGGDQFDSGAFLQDTWTPANSLQFHAALRGSFHQDSDGLLRESDLQTGQTLRDTQHPNRNRLDASARTGVLFKPISWLESRLSAYSGSRQPTLNELYRPFRLGSTSTLANPGLQPETIRGTDLGLKFLIPGDASLQVGAFYNHLENPILTVSEVQGPGFFPEYGFLPTGTAGARRRNLDAAVVKGLEAGFQWPLARNIALQGSWLLTEASVIRAKSAPQLENRTLAQVPAQQAAFGIEGSFWNRLRWSLSERWVSTQFDDDLNQRRLREFFCTDASLSFRFQEHAEIYGTIENLFNNEIQSRLDPSGTVSTASPRIWTAGLRLQF